MPEPSFIHLTHQNYLRTVRAAVGTELFRHVYVIEKQTGKERDVLEDGKLSCAYVVSGLLTLFKLIDRPHATVATTLKKMAEAGWHKIDAPVPGAVVYWPSKEEHGHIGIYLGDGEYMSNSTSKGVPVLHGRTMSDGREPEAFYMHDILLGKHGTTV